MSHSSLTPQRSTPRPRHAGHSPRTAVAAALILLASLGLSACGLSSSDPRPNATALAAQRQVYRQQRAEALELVSCARRHGIDLPAPTADNKISTRGVNLKGRRNAELKACYHKVVAKAAQQQTAQEAREGTSAEQPRSPAQATTAFSQEREQLIQLVACARQHGIHLPEPDAHNHVNTHGVNLKGRRRELAMSNCFHEVVSQATGEQARSPRRFGEESAAP